MKNFLIEEVLQLKIVSNITSQKWTEIFIAKSMNSRASMQHNPAITKATQTTNLFFLLFVHFLWTAIISFLKDLRKPMHKDKGNKLHDKMHDQTTSKWITPRWNPGRCTRIGYKKQPDWFLNKQHTFQGQTIHYWIIRHFLSPFQPPGPLLTPQLDGDIPLS